MVALAEICHRQARNAFRHADRIVALAHVNHCVRAAREIDLVVAFAAVYRHAVKRIADCVCARAAQHADIGVGVRIVFAFRQLNVIRNGNGGIAAYGRGFCEVVIDNAVGVVGCQVKCNRRALLEIILGAEGAQFFRGGIGHGEVFGSREFINAGQVAVGVARGVLVAADCAGGVGKNRAARRD